MHYSNTFPKIYGLYQQNKKTIHVVSTNKKQQGKQRHEAMAVNLSSVDYTASFQSELYRKCLKLSKYVSSTGKWEEYYLPGTAVKRLI